MDLEDLKTDLEIQLAQIQNSIQELKNSSRTSTNSQTDSLIFSELRTLLKEQNEQGKQNLNDNAEKLRSNAAEITTELQATVSRTKSDLQNQLIKVTDSVANSFSTKMKAVEKNICQANDLFVCSVRDGKKEIQEAVKEERKAVFKTWANCLLFILAGILASGIGIVSWNFFKVQDGFYKELAENKKLEQIQNKAVEKYISEVIKDPNAEELKRLANKWKAKHD